MIAIVLVTIALRRRRTLFTRPILTHAGIIALHALEVAVRSEAPSGRSRVWRGARFVSAAATCATGVLLVASTKDMLAFPSAGIDTLTQLPNRFFFMTELERTLRGLRKRFGKSDAAVIFIDLKDFKAVNDRFGHETGDRVLLELGNRLRPLVPAPDVVARIGGDEFAVLMVHVRSPTDIEIVIERIAEAFARPFLESTVAVQVGVNLGSALAAGRNDVSALMRAADDAMYEHKRANTGRRNPGRT